VSVGWVFVGVLLGVACAGFPGAFQASQGSPLGGTDNRVEFDREFTLRNGEAAHVGGVGLILRFERVTEDARCPVGNTCVFAGNAVVLVTVRRPGTDSASLELNTDPGSTTERRYLQYRVRLVRLEPRPVGEQYVPLPQYWATFMVSE